VQLLRAAMIMLGQDRVARALLARSRTCSISAGRDPATMSSSVD
jgi:hypothetical protein